MCPGNPCLDMAEVLAYLVFTFHRPVNRCLNRVLNILSRFEPVGYSRYGNYRMKYREGLHACRLTFY